MRSGTLKKRYRNIPWLLPLEFFFLSFSLVAVFFLVTSAEFENGLYWVRDALRRL